MQLSLPKRLVTRIPLMSIVTLTLLAGLLISAASYVSGNVAVELTEKSLENAAVGRARVLETYAGTIPRAAQVFARNPDVGGAAVDLGMRFKGLKESGSSVIHKIFVTNNPHPVSEREKLIAPEGDSSPYAVAHKRFQPMFGDLLKQGPFRDVLVLNTSGKVFYSYKKGPAFSKQFDDATALPTTLISGLTPLIERLKAKENFSADEVVFTGFSQQPGLSDQLAGYFLAPIIKWNAVIAFVALEIDTTKMSAITSSKRGLGQTGKVVLVNSDFNAIQFDQGSMVEQSGEIAGLLSPALMSSKITKGDVNMNDGSRFRAHVEPMMFFGRNWALLVELNYTELLAPAVYLRNTLILVGLASLLLIGGGTVWFMRRRLSPLGELTEGVKRVAENDLDLEIKFGDREDELGDLSRALEVFKNNAIARIDLETEATDEREKRRARQQNVDVLIGEFRTDARELLASVSENMDGMRVTAENLTGVAEESAIQASSATSASQIASSNVETVAAAAEELSASVEEIRSQVQRTSEVVGQANKGTEKTNQTVGSLSDAAQKIGDVISLIQDIAEQTNLLALNATIEAARAGDQGRGFAVVAAEVKELATQTSNATEEIRSQVQTIQESTTEAVDAIQGIAETMQKVDEYTNSIAAAVDQQGHATNEISRNVADAAVSVREVSENMNSLSSAVVETTETAGKVNQSSSEAQSDTTRLRSAVDTFLEKVAAA